MCACIKLTVPFPKHWFKLLYNCSIELWKESFFFFLKKKAYKCILLLNTHLFLAFDYYSNIYIIFCKKKKIKETSFLNLHLSYRNRTLQ